MINFDVKIKFEDGFHSRPALSLVTIARNSDSNIKMLYKDSEINSKSIISILSASIIKDDLIYFEVDGEDEIAIAESIKNIFK